MTDILINESIRSRTVRLIDDERQNNIFPLHDALSLAYRQGLDLVLVGAGDPPVCRILDASRYIYEKKRADREHARKQREMAIDTKEIQLRPVTDSNDLSIKARRARSFLLEGDKVKVTVRFRGRERSHKEWGRQMIDRFLTEVGDHKIDKPLSDGDSDLTIVLASLVSKADVIRRKVS